MTVSKRILSSLYKAAGKKSPALADDIQAAGGQVYFVRGCVRDFFLGEPIKRPCKKESVRQNSSPLLHAPVLFMSWL